MLVRAFGLVLGILLLPRLASAQIKDATTTLEAALNFETVPIVSKEIVPIQKYGDISENIEARTPVSERYDLPSGESVYKIYSQPTYSKVDGNWYAIDFATITPEMLPTSYLKAPNFWNNYFSWLIEPIAAAVAQTYSGSGDGRVGGVNWTSWSNAYGATSATASNGTTAEYCYTGRRAGTGYFDIYRCFFPFDTSTIVDTDTVSSASIWIYSDGKQLVDNDSDCFFALGGASPASSATLVNNDFDNVQATRATDVQTCSGVVDNSYNRYNLSATGTSLISTTAYSNFVLREGHDWNNSALNVDGNNAIQAYLSEYTGTSRDPYLLATTTAGISSNPTCLNASSTALSSDIDNASMVSYLSYWFYVMISFIILTLGYWLVDKLIHLFRK